MKPASQLKKLVKVGELLKDRLKETERTVEELAEAAEVPTEYITQLISGKRRPPLPARTDIYEKVTRFLGLGRNDLAMCATAERAASTKDVSGPDAEQIRAQLLALCEPETAQQLERRAKRDDAEMSDILGRVLGVVQGSVRRTLDDPIGLRIASAQSGVEFTMLRLRILDFLDSTPDTLSPENLINFVKPKISMWDVDLATGVLRVVLTPHEPPEQNRRRPLSRAGRARSAGGRD